MCAITNFCGRPHIELAVADATTVYNDGQLGRKHIFEYLGFSAGYYATTCF